MKEVKIFVSYKYKKPILKNEIIEPIQTGRAISDEIFKGMIGDDTGENVSSENAKYNELSAQYWVWKNYNEIGNPDYVGFMHYRRHFIFDKSLEHLPFTWLPGAKFYFVKSIYPNYINHFSKEKILPYIEQKPDCIAFSKVNILPISNQPDMKHHFYNGLPAQKKENFEILEQALKENYPEYAQTFEEFKNGTEMYCCNSFVMPKDLFFEYSEFLFGILTKVNKLIDSQNYDEKEIRFLGFMGEYLLSVFLFHKQKNPDFKLIELAGTFVCEDYKKFQKRAKKYMFLSKITFGKKRRHYIKKYINYKRRLEGK